MTQIKTGKLHEYESIVIGGGISGLIIAKSLAEAGQKTLLLESQTAIGGNCRASKTPVGDLNHGFKFIPATDEARTTLIWLQGILGPQFQFDLIDAAPLTYDNGRFQPFVGFGSEKTETASEVSYFASSAYFVVRPPVHAWIQALTETPGFEIALQSHVTKILVEENQIKEILVNGGKRFAAKNYVFSAPTQQLPKLLPDDALPSRTRIRLNKGHYFSAVNIDFVHSCEVTDSRAVHLLRGANEEPQVGIFHPSAVDATGKTYQISQWTTFVPADMTDDAELLAAALKKIKRQMKRAYEDRPFENMVCERISIDPGCFGEAGFELNANETIGKIENLRISNSFFGSTRNLIGSLIQARRVLIALGIEEGSAEIPVEIESPKPSILDAQI